MALYLAGCVVSLVVITVAIIALHAEISLLRVLMKG